MLTILPVSGRYYYSQPKLKTMKKILALLLIISFLYSCSRSVTPYQAASHHYSRCRDMR
jgi:hypothetical protein